MYKRQVNMDGLEIHLFNPSYLGEVAWGTLQSIERDAFASILIKRDQEEIDALVGLDDPRRYMMSHIDPNSEVGRRYNADQSYADPRVAVATADNKLLGFGYSANNVSGPNELVRQAKKLSVVKNYLWLREIVVLPEYQRQGIAKLIGRALLEKANDKQPVTAYAWPDEDPKFMQETFLQLGFSPTDEQPVEIFGEGSGLIRQVRMQAPSVRNVLEHL